MWGDMLLYLHFLISKVCTSMAYSHSHYSHKKTLEEEPSTPEGINILTPRALSPDLNIVRASSTIIIDQVSTNHLFAHSSYQATNNYNPRFLETAEASVQTWDENLLALLPTTRRFEAPPSPSMPVIEPGFGMMPTEIHLTNWQHGQSPKFDSDIETIFGEFIQIPGPWLYDLPFFQAEKLMFNNCEWMFQSLYLPPCNLLSE